MSFLKKEFIGAYIDVLKYAKFNSVRKTIISQNPEFHMYLHKKGKSIETLIDVFLEFNEEVLNMIRKLKELK